MFIVKIDQGDYYQYRGGNDWGRSTRGHATAFNDIERAWAVAQRYNGTIEELENNLTQSDWDKFNALRASLNRCVLALQQYVPNEHDGEQPPQVKHVINEAVALLDQTAV